MGNGPRFIMILGLTVTKDIAFLSEGSETES